jgi:PKD repeat protein
MRRIILTIATALIGLLLLGMAACGRRGNKTPGQGAVLHSSQTTTIQDALAQLDALEKPEGVDAKLWNELKGALKSALTTKNHQPTTRTTSTPPTGDINKVNDFAISDHGDGSYTLSWHYRNLGDYITPLAMHFGKTYNFELEANTIQAVADGSLNGTVGIEDVTQIAMYFGTECAGYFLRTSPAPPASVEETTELDFLPLDLAQGEGRIAYGADHPLPSHTYIAVAPVDGDGVLGELSNVVLSPNHSPGAALTVDPAEGDAPLTVGLDAGESSDMDGPIAKYEWDFEGDGVWDEDSGTLSYVEHVYETPDFYYPVVRVTDAEGAQDTAEASVFAGQWRISTAVTDLFPGAGATSLEVVNGNPAICFYAVILGVPDEGYWYVRANNPLGEAWNSPILVYGGMVAGVFECDDTLAIVNGFPGVMTYDGDDSSLNYLRAEDINGVAWGTPLEIRMADSKQENAISMAIIDGRPAVAYSNSRLQLVRALDADGTGWGIPVEVASEGKQPSMAVVNGAPAISFIVSGGGLRYVRANDVSGETWGAPVTIGAESGYKGSRGASLATVDGHPAISYLAWVNDGTKNYHLRYIRASDDIGNAWGQPQTLDNENGTKRWPTSLAVINGRPAIAYDAAPPGTTDLEIRYLWARDSAGSSWGNPVKIDDGDFCSLKEINGAPAIAYFRGAPSASEIRFAIYR